MTDTLIQKSTTGQYFVHRFIARMIHLCLIWTCSGSFCHTLSALSHRGKS